MKTNMEESSREDLEILLNGGEDIRHLLHTPASFRPATGQTLASLRPSTSGILFDDDDDDDFEENTDRLQNSTRTRRRRPPRIRQSSVCLRRKDCIDLAIEDSRSEPPCWLQDGFRKRMERMDVKDSIWRFERNAHLVDNQFRALTKVQLLQVLRNMPMKLPTLARESGSELQIPKNIESLSKDDLVFLMKEADMMYWKIDEKERARIQKEEEESKNRLSDDESNDNDEDFQQIMHQDESKAHELVDSHNRVNFTIQTLTGSCSQTIIPEQGFMMNKLFFSKKKQLE